MKTNKKQLSLGLMAAATAITIPITTVVSCGDNKDSDASKINSHSKYGDMIKKSEQEISKYDDDTNKVIDSKTNKVKLVALGDSIASGFTLLEGLTDKHQGYYDSKTQKVSGISYSSFLARAFKEKGVLSDFNNYAIAGATTASLAKQVDPEYKMSLIELRDKRKRDLVLKPEGAAAKRAKEIHTKLKEANIVTISIGANDILRKIKITGKSLNELMENPTSFSLSGGISNLVDFGSESEMGKIVEIAKSNLIHTISKIKSVNPTAKIVLVGYPMPLNQLGGLLKLIDIEKNGRIINVVNELLAKLSSVSTSISKKFKSIDYIDTNVPMEWDVKATSLTSKLLDIHPGPKGYREMAAIILANLSGQKSLFKSNITNDDDVEKRLVADYYDIILRYAEKDPSDPTKYKEVPLRDSEPQAVQAKTKPAELVRFVAKMIDTLSNSLLGTQEEPASTRNSKDLYQATALNPINLLLMVKKADPFITAIFKSAEMGYKNSDETIRDAVDQDLKYIIAKLVDTITKKLDTLDPNIKRVVEVIIGKSKTLNVFDKVVKQFFEKTDKYIRSTEAKSLKTFVNWFDTNKNNETLISKVLIKGIAKLDYTK